MLVRCAALVVLCVSVPPSFAADPVAREFKIALAADLTMTAGKKEVPLTADGEFRYAWARQGDESTLLLRAMSAKSAVDGRTLLSANMSRARFTAKQGSESVDTKFEDAPDELKSMLRDTFDAPLCKLKRDASGKETKRTLVAGDGAKELVDDGLIANTLLFHPPFVVGAKAWTAKVGVSSGQGLATGDLTYTSASEGKGVRTVKVSGTLAADGVKTEGGFLAKDAKYVVTGSQSYDPELKEWVAGALDIDMTLTLVRGKESIPAKGKLKATFEILPEKKK